MGNGYKRILSIFLAAAMLFGCVLTVVPQAEAVAFENTYENTGDQRADIIGVALTQVGYREGNNNDTKYGSWYGLFHDQWCAMFVSWCARQAEISTDILGRSAMADPDWGYFDIPYYRGDQYTPKPGDLFFTYNETHVGLVYYVEGEYFYTIEGNTNEDGSADGYGVLIRQRTLSSYYLFGVPDYEGYDKAHTYERHQEQTHPHRSYYKCTTCGDQYYTGYTACVDSCSSCMSCGCSASSAGYYICTGTDLNVYVRAGHGTGYDVVGGLSTGIVVYVHGMSNGWAYIEYDGMRGHVLSRYLQSYYPAPDAPAVSASNSEFVRGDTVKLDWKSDSYTEEYRLEIYKDGQQQIAEAMGLKTSYTMTALQPGSYEVRVIAGNKTGSSKPGVFNFVVYDTYTVSYDVRGGSAGPAAQTKVQSKVLTLSSDIPTKEGYTFLGWTDDAHGNFVVYRPGDSFLADANTTLYAVWKSDEAALETLEIAKMPNRTMFVQGTELDTTGLELKLIYADGSGQTVTDGYTTEGFSSQELGTKTVTVTYDTLTVTYDVQILDYIPGDFNENFVVDEDDAIYLLRHVLFSELYPIHIPGDFTADGQITEDDAIYLLRHVLFPELYPLG